MLVFTRKSQQSVAVAGPIDPKRVLKITVLDIRASTVKLGFDTTDEVAVHRWEVWQRINTNDSSTGNQQESLDA